MTSNKSKKTEKYIIGKEVFLALEKVSSFIPAPIYWEDVNSTIIGANEHVLSAVGLQSLSDYIGKTLYELYPKEMADAIKLHNEEVMRTGKILSQEEAIVDITTGETKYFKAVKAPLYNKRGKIIGVIGTSIDLTAEKEAIRLKHENELSRKLIQEQKKFLKITSQAAHDIRSPVASVLMIIKSCSGVPEAERIALREAAMNIEDIVHNLLSQYKLPETVPEISERQPLLVSVTLMQLLTDKKYECPQISWVYDVNQVGHFAFIKVQSSPFKRMLSNLINNAVDACEGYAAKIEVQIKADNEWVTIIIKDNGKGMTPDFIRKIKQQVAITSGKKNGYGLGLTQVRETVRNNQGQIFFESEVGQGTKITLTFPRIKAPDWMAEEIKLKNGDLLIILDDDTSIHQAWQTRFQGIMTEKTNIEHKHFSMGQEALDFLLSLPANKKPHIFLLTDYELLKQDMDGLTVIEQSGIERSILVTSHYANLALRDRAAKVGTKILPKRMASEIPIEVIEAEAKPQANQVAKVDIVLVDDNKNFVENLVNYAFMGLAVDSYYDPHHFLNSVGKYTKDTKMVLDNQFEGSNISGIELAKNLHEQGYTRLYILSGKDFVPGEVPGYVKVIRKENIENIWQIARD
jgi:signal transduction histidine kinase